MDDFEIPSLLFRVQGYADLLSVENPETTTETNSVVIANDLIMQHQEYIKRFEGEVK